MTCIKLVKVLCDKINNICNKMNLKIKTLTNTKLSVYHLSLVIQFARGNHFGG